MCCILFCTLLSIGYGVGFFVVGGLFYDDPCEKDLAIWCIVQGSLYFGRMAIPSLILRIGRTLLAYSLLTCFLSLTAVSSFHCPSFSIFQFPASRARPALSFLSRTSHG
jgi:hypothetical protein